MNLPAHVFRQLRQHLERGTELADLDGPGRELYAEASRDFLAKLTPTKRIAKALPGKSIKAKRLAKRLAHGIRTDLVRAEVWRRSEGRCEACGLQIPDEIGELDHFIGGSRRRRLTNTSNCWRLDPECHRNKTNNKPSRAWWLGLFEEHCENHGYPVPASLR